MRCRTSRWPMIGTGAATATTSSAGPPARRSSTESRLLRIASPMFHFGILVVIAGHVIGLVIRESWTLCGRSERTRATTFRR